MRFVIFPHTHTAHSHIYDIYMCFVGCAVSCICAPHAEASQHQFLPGEAKTAITVLYAEYIFGAMILDIIFLFFGCDKCLNFQIHDLKHIFKGKY